MKKKRDQTIKTKILEDTQSAKKLPVDIVNLTVEDVVVLYAYAEAIVETVREPLVILDGNLRVKTANKSFFDTFKVMKKDTYNKLIFELGNNQWNIPELKKLLNDVLNKNSQFDNFEVQHDFEDIGHKTMLLNARRIVLEGHKTELILLAIEDITQKKIIDKQKDDFIGIVSHELKTPLTSTKAFVQILQLHNHKTQDKKNIFILDKISKQVMRMEHMMSSFLNVYTLQSGKLELHKEDFLVDDLLKDILETFEYSTDTHIIYRKGNTVNKIHADRERIGQVITNLLTNAIKYSPSKDRVVVVLKEDGNAITVSVQDFGIGIPKEQHDLIFNRFFRAKGTEKQKIQGVGLGLYIAYEIIKEHKGKMWVESSVGKGSTFYFSLPLIKKRQ